MRRPCFLGWSQRRLQALVGSIFGGSSALLYNGDLIVGNTGDNNMVEIQPSTMTVVGMKSVDSGAPGAIFGIATSGTTIATQKIYFNDDNTATVNLVSQ